MPLGSVKFYNTQKGFGFIIPDDGSPDVFVHVTALDDAGIETLQPGDRLSFEIGINSKNGRAKAIKLRPAAGIDPTSNRSHLGLLNPLDRFLRRS